MKQRGRVYEAFIVVWLRWDCWCCCCCYLDPFSLCKFFHVFFSSYFLSFLEGIYSPFLAVSLYSFFLSNYSFFIASVLFVFFLLDFLSFFPFLSFHFVFFHRVCCITYFLLYLFCIVFHFVSVLVSFLCVLLMFILRFFSLVIFPSFLFTYHQLLHIFLIIFFSLFIIRSFFSFTATSFSFFWYITIIFLVTYFPPNSILDNFPFIAFFFTHSPPFFLFNVPSFLTSSIFLYRFCYFSVCSSFTCGVFSSSFFLFVWLVYSFHMSL